MAEREIVTVGFGNYSTLVAAQWVNSTSHYDVHHRTLYHERSRAHTIGGTVGHGTDRNDDDDDDGVGLGGAGTVRVPRLLLLDAPHASDFRDLLDVEHDMEQQRKHDAEEEEERAKGSSGGGHRDPTAAHHQQSSSSLLWGPQLGSDGWQEPSREEKQVGKAVRFAQRRWQQHHSNSNSNNDDDDEDNDDDRYYFRLKRRQGGNGGNEEQENTGGIETDAAYASHPQERDVNGTEEEEEEGQQKQQQQPDDKARSKDYYKRKLFRSKDGTVPWWRYITTGLDVDSITTLRPPQHVDGGGDIPTMHSFGHGLSTFKSTVTGGSAAEAERLGDALRRQLEAADLLQGLQCFIDGDGMFGGAAHNTLTEFWEDAGPKVPVAAFTTFVPLPPVFSDREASRDVPFAERRRGEVCLNRLLATSLLSAHPSALYIPIELGDWPKLMSIPRAPVEFGTKRETGPEQSCWWVDDDTASAQYIAAVADSALFGAREGFSGGEQNATNTSNGNSSNSNGPAFYMYQWAQTLRPQPSMRVSALLGSLPLPLQGNGGDDLSHFLQRHPLLPSVAVDKAYNDEPHQMSRGDFVPMTHAFTQQPTSTAGRVVAHALSLRGAGALASATHPAREAILRYGRPLGTSTFLPTLTRANMPVSATFPLPLLFASEAEYGALDAQLRGAGLDTRAAFAERGVDVGAHVVTTYQSAAMLRGICDSATAALRFKSHMYNVTYDYEKDDWTERIEDVMNVWDDYRHGDEGDDDGEDGDW